MSKDVMFTNCEFLAVNAGEKGNVTSAYRHRRHTTLKAHEPKTRDG
jgi:hypothetical protein